MSKHTPSPWFIQGDHGKRWIETGGNDDTIAQIHRRADRGSVYSCQESLANARLISAAPDLLEAAEHCRELLMRYEVNRVNGEEIADEAIAKLNAAIAKAKGEQA